MLAISKSAAVMLKDSIVSYFHCRRLPVRFMFASVMQLRLMEKLHLKNIEDNYGNK